MTHRLAFTGPGVQITAADIEDWLMPGAIRDVPDRPPVFITSLPRAGATVILNAMDRLPSVATHRYRDMPFILSPMLWHRLSARSRRKSEMRERAHGDGLEVGFDSPEAFEEIIWRIFWPENYGADRIALWGAADRKDAATEFLRKHFRKIVALRTGGAGRYVSKNNGNIARLDLLPGMFAHCQIVVPLRRPVEYAASLLRQHRVFLALHRADPFTARYMQDIGRLEIGALHKPIDSPDFDPGGMTPDQPDYWLANWIAAPMTAACWRRPRRSIAGCAPTRSRFPRSDSNYAQNVETAGGIA